VNNESVSFAFSVIAYFANQNGINSCPAESIKKKDKNRIQFVCLRASPNFTEDVPIKNVELLT